MKLHTLQEQLFFASCYWPKREISITPRYSWGKKNTHELFLGGVWEHFQPPSSSNNSKNTSKTAATRPRARRRPDAAAVFAGVFAVVAAAWGAGSVPIHPPEIARGCFFPAAISGRDTYLPLATIVYLFHTVFFCIPSYFWA